MHGLFFNFFTSHTVLGMFPCLICLIVAQYSSHSVLSHVDVMWMVSVSFLGYFCMFMHIFPENEFVESELSGTISRTVNGK